MTLIGNKRRNSCMKQIGFYEDVCQMKKLKIFYGTIMTQIMVDISEEKESPKKLFRMDFIGQIYSRMPDNLWRDVIIAKEQATCQKRMQFHSTKQHSRG